MISGRHDAKMEKRDHFPERIPGKLFQMWQFSAGTDLREAFEGQPPPDWQEEVQAISAIHANNFQQKGLGRMDLCVDNGRTYLDLRIPDAYPETPPLIAVR